MTHSHRKTEPTNIRSLVDACEGDTTKAAAFMDSHPSTIQKALNDNVTTEKQESRAAVGLNRLAELRKLEELQAEALRPVEAVLDRVSKHMLVTVPPAKLEAFQRVAQVMGIEMVAL